MTRKPPIRGYDVERYDQCGLICALHPTEHDHLRELDKKIWDVADRLRCYCETVRSNNLIAAVRNSAYPRFGLITFKYNGDYFEIWQQEAQAQLEDKDCDFHLYPDDHKRPCEYKAALSAGVEDAPHAHRPLKRRLIHKRLA